MKLKDALTLVKLPPQARQSVETRMAGWIARSNPEYKAALARLRSQVPQHAKNGWRYCHTVLRGRQWCHVFERQMVDAGDWSKLMRSTCTEESFDEIIIVAMYVGEDMHPHGKVVSFLPKEGVVNVWPLGSRQYKTVMARLYKMQPRRVRRDAETFGNW